MESKLKIAQNDLRTENFGSEVENMFSSTDLYTEEMWHAHVKLIATAFAHNPLVVGLDLRNEIRDEVFEVSADV